MLSTLKYLHISYLEGDYESDNYMVVFQPGDTSAELRIPILDDSLGVEGTEDFFTVVYFTSLLECDWCQISFLLVTSCLIYGLLPIHDIMPQ